ncbi:hypothetical protein ACMZ75_05935 [Gardnerella piotii]|uniref:hypothetical protein n=1 Tax=Gardnerella piotii TaxID=2792977 RepID=UPI0039F094CD
MMNKKAIAAFAAGATLLAGFAMATPAFALYKSDAEKTVQTTKAAWKEAKDAFDKMVKPDEKKDKPADLTGTAATYFDSATGALKKDLGTSVNPTEYNKAQTYVQQLAAYNAKVKAYNDKKDEVARLKKAYDNAVLAKEDATDDPVSSKSSLQGALLGAKGDFDDAVNKLEDAYAKANAAKSDLLAANANLDEKAAAVQRFVTAHELKSELDTTDLSKDDKLQLAELRNERDGASTAVAEATKAFNNLDREMNKALTKARGAWSAYKTAFEAAKEKDSALVAGYPDPATVNPLPAKYQYGLTHVTPGASHAGKPGAAKPGKPGQAAGQAGANGSAAAGAKTEVENKNGKDKRGNTHTGTGVGVTLTALAATMLAGMGAAVRKARH